MLAHLRDLIPGTALWPTFERNRSEQFESRLVMVEILASRSPLFTDMAGSRLPVVVAHGEGRASYETPQRAAQALSDDAAVLRYVDNQGQADSVLSSQSEWFDCCHSRSHNRRRTGNNHDAAPRTPFHQLAIFSAARGLAECGRPVVQDVP